MMSDRHATTTLVAGVMTLAGSFGTWITCTTIGCDSPLQGFDWFSGTAMGYGWLTALSAIVLIGVSLHARLRGEASPYRRAVAPLGLFIIVVVAAFVVEVYVRPGIPRDQLGPWSTATGFPSYGALLAALGGVVALAVGLPMARYARAAA